MIRMVTLRNHHIAFFAETNRALMIGLNEYIGHRPINYPLKRSILNRTEDKHPDHQKPNIIFKSLPQRREHFEQELNDQSYYR